MPDPALDHSSGTPLPPLANLRNLLRIWDGPFVIFLAGIAFLFTIHWLVVERLVMPVTRARLVEVDKFLKQQAGESRRGGIYLLGSSVLLEGVDCNRIDLRLPDGMQSYNLALMGAGAPQWILIAPALREVKPDRVVMVLDLTGVTGLQTIPEEGMAIAEYWNFFTPESEQRFTRFFTPEQLAALDRSDFASLIAFRVFPIGAYDMYMREVSRPELRYDGYTTNFKDPWVRRTRVSDASTDRWIADKVSKVDATTPEMMDRQIAMIEALVEWFAEAGERCVLAVAPVNPKLAAAVGNSETSRIMEQLRRLSDQTGAPLFDYRTLLSEQDFADHVHPYEPGRLRWSDSLAVDLGTLVSSDGGEE